MMERWAQRGNGYESGRAAKGFGSAERYPRRHFLRELFCILVANQPWEFGLGL